MTTSLILRTRGGATLETTLDDLLGPDGREQTREKANAWIKQLRLAPYDSDTMRTRFRYRGTSLWWFTEIYLHKRRNMDAAVATVLALNAARERHGAVGVEVRTPHPTVHQTALSCGRQTGLRVTAGPPPRASDDRWHAYLAGLLPRLATLRPHGRRSVDRARIAAFIHAAFSRPSGEEDAGVQEQYVGPVLNALFARADPGAAVCVQVGPHRNFRARTWWDPLVPRTTPVLSIERLAGRRALAGSHELWQVREALARELVAGEGIRSAACVHGVDLWSVLETELLAVARLQWPWAARAMDQAAAAFDALEPEVAVTYAEAGGWGRALVVEARRRGIRTVGLQHGFIYRHWLNYLHEDDEMRPDDDGDVFPRPDTTLVFDEFAARHLRDQGRFPAGSLQVTGNPRLDVLADAFHRDRTAARARLRQQVGASPDTPLAVLTVKHSELSGELDAIDGALTSLTDLHLIIKPHPAETEATYATWAGGRPRLTILPVTTSLAACLAAADVVLTRNSTVAIDALVLGVPTVVMGLPTNLSPFVDAGAMAGAATAEELRLALERVLYDRDARGRLLATGRAFAQAHQMHAGGRAAERSADVILPQQSSSPQP